MNFFEKRNKKSNLSKNGIATILGTEKKKIEELESGERNITGETFKKYIDATNMSETEVKLEYAKLVEWYRNTNLRQLRKDFGYINLRSVADKIGIHYSTLCNIENHKVNKPDFAILFKLKDFYSNDFNKNLEKKEENVEIKVKESENKNTEVKNENSEIDNIKKWYKNTDLKKIMLKYNLDYKNTSKDLNIPYSSFYELINKKNKAHSVERIANLKTYIDNLENQNNTEMPKGVLKELQDGIKVDEDNNISETKLETTSNDILNTVEQDLGVSENIIDCTPLYTPLFVKSENSAQQLHTSDIDKEPNKYIPTETDILNLKINRYEKIIDILLKQLGE